MNKKTVIEIFLFNLPTSLAISALQKLGEIPGGESLLPHLIVGFGVGILIAIKNSK